MNRLIISILMMSQVLNCQDKDTKSMNHFHIEGNKIFYNGQRITLGMPIEDFVKLVNSDYRIARNYNKGRTDKSWRWGDGGEAYVKDNGKIDYFNINMNDESLEKEYNSIEEIIKKVGMYDSYEEREIPSEEDIFYVFDGLGFSVFTGDNSKVVEQINIYPILFTKTTLKPVLFKEGPGSLNALSDKEKEISKFVDDTNDIENYKIMLDRHPKTEFKGKFSYYDNTADFAKIGYTDWDKMVSDLKLSSRDYDPPGDSESWSREIRADYDSCMVDIDRYNNTSGYNFDQPSYKAVGKMDGVKSIEIYRH